MNSLNIELHGTQSSSIGSTSFKYLINFLQTLKYFELESTASSIGKACFYKTHISYVRSELKTKSALF